MSEISTKSSSVVNSFEVAATTAVYLMAGFAFGALISGKVIPIDAWLVLVVVAGLIAIFFDSSVKRISNLENHLRGLALLLGGLSTGLGWL